MSEEEPKVYTAAEYERLHAKWRGANAEVARIRIINKNLEDLNADLAKGREDEIPLRRRIIMQRREIKEAWKKAKWYQTMWLSTRRALNELRKKAG